MTMALNTPLPLAATPRPITPGDADPSVLCALVEGGTVALVRIVGRGNFQNSFAFKQFAELVQGPGKPHQFIIDLGQCPTMDSTFMGVLASVGIRQEKSGNGKLIVINANEQSTRLLKTLGLTHLLEVRHDQVGDLVHAEGALQPAQVGTVSRVEQICIMLEAHKQLIDLDNNNEVRFRSVVEMMEDSLRREQDKQATK